MSRLTRRSATPWILTRLAEESGSSLVEYALVVILFMTILFGIIGFGHALYAYHFVSHATKEATRYAAVRGRTCGNDANGGSCQASNSASGSSGPTKDIPNDIQKFVQNIAPPGINTDPKKLVVTATWPVQANSPTICSAAVAGVGGPYADYPGCTVQVQVQYTFNFIVPLIPAGPLTLSSRSDMIIAH